MNPLSYKQKVKVQAALALIHDAGHDAKAVGRAAQSGIARGLDPKASYERALAEFAKGKPDIANMLSKTLRVIEASSPQTVAAYGAALEEYNQTGNPAATAAIAQTFVQDSIALAVHLGEMSQADAANPDAVAGAFGFPFGEGAGERVVAMAGMNAPAAAPVAPAASPATPAAPSQIVQAPAAATSPQGSQAGYSGGFQSMIRQKAEPSSVITKGYTESNSYGGYATTKADTGARAEMA
jgi:hypothetical protein